MRFTKILILGLLCLSTALTATAQTLSDSEAIAYAKQRNSAGADAKTISAELITKGATPEQLQRLADQIQNGGSAGTNSSADFSRDRVNNEENVDLDSENTVETRKIFGHDIFRSKLLSFEPNMSMAISPRYVLGPGDEMIIDVYGASSSSQKIKIAPDGTVTIPKIGPVGVSGLTVEQAQARVHSAMGRHYQNASIKVSVGQTRTISINVMGEVLTPGTYTLSAFATVFHALYMAGGINELGTLRDIKVARNGRIISTIDVYEYIVSGRLVGDVKLQDNDVIIVGAYENIVEITGKVKRPMFYEMKKNESVQSLIRFSGGFTGDAYTKSITINRRAGHKLSLYTVDEFDFNSFRLQDADSVSVGGNEQRYENIITINGAVKRPGQYGLSTVKSVRNLIEVAGGLQEDAVMNRAVLTRMNLDRTLKTITIDLEGILAGTSPDIALENEDVIDVASLAGLHDDRTMTIEGEVFNGNTFPYAENTSIEDLIMRAGGLKQSASLLNVEVSRRIIDPSAVTDSIVKCETFRFTLNPDLSVNGDNNFKLKPYDRVYIRRSPVYDIQTSVTLSGEVVFAGNYGLKDNKTRISDVIREAGGLKKNASARNARLMRKYTEAEVARFNQLNLMKQYSTDSLVIQDIQIGDSYSVGINLENAIANPGSKDDLIMLDGDEIIVPGLVNTVKISGEVLYPNSITFEPGKKAKYYIEQAGGYTNKSYKKHAYIVYANGHVCKVSKGKVEPGCEIIVPVKEQKDHSNDLMKWVSIGSSITTLAILILNYVK